MATPEEIREQGLTTDDVMEREFAQPRRSVEWVPEWDEYPEERPGENARIEGEILIWERGGFEVRLESYETTHWRADLSIPERVGRHYPRKIDMKCASVPGRGFVDQVEIDDYHATTATLVLQENFQPIFELNQFIDELLNATEEREEFENEIQEKLAAAREVEQQQKEQRDPGWSDDHDAFVCPHCKETSTQLVERDDGGHDCMHCGESVDEYVESEPED